MNDQDHISRPTQQFGDCQGNELQKCSGCLNFCFPERDALLNQLTVAAGRAAACVSVQLYIDDVPAGQTSSNRCGYWELPLPVSPEDGVHILKAIAGCETCCLSVTIDGGRVSVPVPDILYPAGLIQESAPVVRGTAQPGIAVRVCVDGSACQTVLAGEDGTWSWQYPEPLTEGQHIITAVAIGTNGAESDLAYQLFETQTAAVFSVILELAQEGSRFRTIGLALEVASPAYPVTLYYLMLPPGSPVPVAEDIMNYSGSGLEDGTAASGSVVITTGGETVLDISGREGAAAGAMGLLDGYHYDIYLVARALQEQSPVLSALNVRAMPFGGGRGTEQSPYRIYQLGADEIREKYPDLAADRSPVGVDDTARLLRNIEYMQVLYRESGGRHGVRNSMSLDYELVSPIDLVGYVAANQGTGWRALGFQGNNTNPAQFRGILSGSGSETPIRELTIIRSDLHLYEGLFAYGYHAVFRGLVIQDTVIRVSRSQDPEGQEETRVGPLCAQMEGGGSLQDISARGTTITIGSGIHDFVDAGAGALVWEAAGAVDAQDLYGENIRITVTHGGYRVGGLFGRVIRRGNGAPKVQRALVRNCVIQTEKEYAGGIAGQAHFTELMKDLKVENSSFTAHGFVGGIAGQYLALNRDGSLTENVHCTDSTMSASVDYCGGLFGQYNLEYAHTIRNCTVTDCKVNNNSYAGGLAGSIELSGPQKVEDCHVTGGSIHSTYANAGGFAGEIVYYHTEETSALPSPMVSDCTVTMDIPVSAPTLSGGFAGRIDISVATGQQILFTNCRSQAAAQCTGNYCGGFAGTCKIGRFTQCAAAGDTKANANAGGFAGQVQNCLMSECRAEGSVVTQSPASGGFAGIANDGAVIQSCTASGDVRSDAGSTGGIFGSAVEDEAAQTELHEVVAENCRFGGSIEAGSETGGIGGLCDGTVSVIIRNNLVTSLLISGDTPTGRIIGGFGDHVTLSSNYSSTTDIRQDGVLKPIIDDPDGQDGGNLPASEKGDY